MISIIIAIALMFTDPPKIPVSEDCGYGVIFVEGQTYYVIYTVVEG